MVLQLGLVYLWMAAALQTPEKQSARFDDAMSADRAKVAAYQLLASDHSGNSKISRFKLMTLPG